MNPQETKSYSPGLDGVIAGESAICWVDPDSGLRYRGYNVEELAGRCDFEQVAWLLLNGELPSAQEHQDFRKLLAKQGTLDPDPIETLRRLTKSSRPMDWMRSGISMLAAFDPEVGVLAHEANVRKAHRLIGRMTSLVTAGWNLSLGRTPAKVDEEPSLAARFLGGLDGSIPQPWRVRAIDIVLILYAEHEFNASTFAARVTASTLADIYPAIVTAIGTLEGPLHGGANEQAMNMLNEIASPDRAEEWVKQRLAKKEKIMGFGHRVYKKGDSRVPVMRELLALAGRETSQPRWLEICLKLDEVMLKEKGLFANLDLYAAPVLHLLRIPPALNTPVFACARVAGWCAHVIEQQDHNRLIRPRCLYMGSPPRSIPVNGLPL